MHEVEVSLLGPLTKHPNADTLSIVKIGDTEYTYVAKTSEWQEGTLVAWIPPDSIVDLEREEFAFLKAMKSKHPERVRARKIRGIVSYGLLVKAPVGSKVGDDVRTLLNVTHYQPQIRTQGGSFCGTNAIPGPEAPGYDVDHFLKHGKRVFKDGEPVVVTEKIHGATGRYMFADGQMWCGSRESWKSEYSLPSKMTLAEILEKVVDPVKAQAIYDRVSQPGKVRNMWWAALPEQVRSYCMSHPGRVVYGEVYGYVQDMKYGAKEDEYWFRVFDVLLVGGMWMDAEALLKEPLPLVPLVGVVPFDFDAVKALAEGQSTLAPHIREGVVVKPVKERWHESIGRVSLKVINPAYLES